MVHKRNKCGKERELNQLMNKFTWVVGVFAPSHCTDSVVVRVVVRVMHLVEIEVCGLLVKLQPGVESRGRDRQHVVL